MMITRSRLTSKLRRYILGGAIVTGWISLAVPSLAEVNPPYVHPLTVQIDANDDELNNLVKSYLSRELRSLKDVTINEAPQPTFIIHCGCLPAMLNGVKVGYALSFVITSNLSPLKYIASDKYITDVLDKSPEGRIYALRTMLTGMCRLTQQFEDQFLFTCATDNLKDRCESFVASFDTKYLDPLRNKHD
jgi:hypothetical protein